MAIRFRGPGDGSGKVSTSPAKDRVASLRKAVPAVARLVEDGDGGDVADGASVMIHIRVRRDVLDWFKAGGPGYQTRINAALRKAMEDGGE